MAREHAPSIIFMDEIDSIGSSRGEGGKSGGDSEVQRTMLELLNQLDGFEGTKNIKVSVIEVYSIRNTDHIYSLQVIMATNRIDILDSALLRPGRIDRKIEFPPPGPEARVSILRIHSRKVRQDAEGQLKCLCLHILPLLSIDVASKRYQSSRDCREDGSVQWCRGEGNLHRGR
jgi:ATP-dependent 26S proteasome regulatory subunit